MEDAQAVETTLEDFNPFGFGHVVNFALFMIVTIALRIGVLQGLMAMSRSQFADKTRITKKPTITKKQHKRESVWPLGFVLDFIFAVGLAYLGFWEGFPVFDVNGFAYQLVIHCTIVEFIYYWFHRVLHWKSVYKAYHQYHHQSINTEPTTSLSFEIGERLAYTVLFAVPGMLAWHLGANSYITFGFQMVWFDIMNELGHSNFEICPRWFMDSFLGLIWYTPSYHSIHHTRFKFNYSLFMPWPDLMFGTADMERTKTVFFKALDGVNSSTASKPVKEGFETSVAVATQNPEAVTAVPNQV